MIVVIYTNISRFVQISIESYFICAVLFLFEICILVDQIHFVSIELYIYTHII